MSAPMKSTTHRRHGLPGEYLLAELLERGHSVLALYRSESRKLDTIHYLSSMGLPEVPAAYAGLKGEVLDADTEWENWCRECEGLEEVDTHFSTARLAQQGCTWMQPASPSEPTWWRRQGISQAGGTRKPMNVHLVSTSL